eukprot:CAMPEP_0197843396 /NCGR_PEP_ID=MMETSP1438-20131217/268_1 /TAXON_ID=1461541 /ORGANISM="Pterosperma sp., Strain CCMP1384" /LENGTH=58 /DNA_ID=CAMNT_0043453511 /DNA_START=490 /DNA_END=663 /DNA_ORIENTATION=-
MLLADAIDQRARIPSQFGLPRDIVARIVEVFYSCRYYLLTISSLNDDDGDDDGDGDGD